MAKEKTESAFATETATESASTPDPATGEVPGPSPYGPAGPDGEDRRSGEDRREFELEYDETQDLRDNFAMAALQSFNIPVGRSSTDDETRRDLARGAWAMADAMIAER